MQGTRMLPVWDVQSTETVFCETLTERVHRKWWQNSATLSRAVFCWIGSSLVQVGQWLCSLVQVGQWLCSVVQVGQWLCSLVQVGQWLCSVQQE